MRHFRLALAAATLTAWSCAAAGAADLATVPVKAPVAATLYNWSGLYVGVNGGYGWGNQDPIVLFGNRLDRSSMNVSGGMFGATAGAQIQQGYVVLGFEGD